MAVPPPLLVMDRPTVTVLRLSSGTTPAAIGGALNVHVGQQDDGAQVAHVTAWNGRLYAANPFQEPFGAKNLRVYEYNPTTASWAQIGIAGIGYSSTLEIYNSGGSTHVVSSASGSIVAGFFMTGPTHQINRWTWDGNTFTTSTAGASGTGHFAGRSILWRNIIYAMTHDGVMAIDPVNANSTIYSPGWASSNARQGAFCVFRDRLFILRHPALNQPASLYELSGGAWVNRGAMVGAGASTGGTMLAESNHALFAVGNTKMVAIYLDQNGANYGSRACDIPDPSVSGGWTDVTTTLIPGSLQPSASVANADHFWTVFTDNESDPTTPVVFLWHGSDYRLGSYSYFEYVNSASTLGPGTAAGSCSYRLPGQPTGGGERVNYDITLPDTDLQATQTAAPLGVLGGVRLTFRVAGGTNGNAGRRTDVNFATIAPLPANTWNAVAGPGAILTANANGPLSVDGTPVAATNRILVKDEGSPERNGIYTVTDAGSGGSPFILLRATDFDIAAPTEVAAGAWCRVLSGGSLANTYWQMSQVAAITVDTTALTWLQLATRFVRIFYNNQYNSDQTQATLFGTPTGLPWVIRNGNVIEGVIADNATLYTLDWNITAGPNSYVIRVGVS